ncbi:hypothetical protein Tco_0738437, partial [Tanacetum coccineum]
GMKQEDGEEKKREEEEGVKSITLNVLAKSDGNRSWRRRQKFNLTPSGLKSDDVTTKCDGVTVANKKNPFDDSTG